VYAGRPGYGGQLPYSLGERSNAPFNLAGVGPSGHGPYLGDFFDELTKIAHKVGIISGEVGKVARGESTVATIPKGQATFTLPLGGGMSQAVPLWVLGAGAAGLAYFAFRKRR
jgi:hypothetical protein